MRIAQITDSHLLGPGVLWKGRVEMAEKLQAAVARLNAIGPDLVVHTGDLVDGGGEAEYGVAAEILSALKPPLRLLPGNHDRRERMRAAFPRAEWAPGDHLQFAEDAGGLRLIGLDTVDPGRTAGRLCPDRLAWLADRLAGDRPALIFLHHPPCPMGLPHMDRFVFEGSAETAAVLARAPVLRLACGHVHAAAERHWAGTLVAACPALGVQIPPAADPGAPLGFTLEPAAIRLHDWSEDLGLTVKTVPVADFPGPYPFETDPAADFDRTPHAD